MMRKNYYFSKLCFLFWLVLILATMSVAASQDSALTQLGEALRTNDRLLVDQMFAPHVELLGSGDVLSQGKASRNQSMTLIASELEAEYYLLFEAYQEHYYPELDTLLFILEFRGSESYWEEDNDDEWSDIWYWILRDHGAKWDEEYGDWDEAEMEVLFYEMYLDMHELEDRYDYSAEAESLSLEEREMLKSIASLLDLYRQDATAANFVAAAIPIYYEYVLSDQSWEDEVTTSLSDYFQVSRDSIKISQAGNLEISKYLLVDLLFE